MASIAYPVATIGKPRDFILTLRSSYVESRSPYSGYLQSVENVGSAHWSARIIWPPHAAATETNAAAIEALLHRLRSRVDTLALYDFRREAPLGTMRGSPTLGSSAAQFATTINISGTGTLKAGDRLGIAGQLVVVTQDTSNLTSVTIDPPLRAARASGTAVVWDRPTAQFTLAQSELTFGHSLATFEPITVELQEVL